MHKNVTNAKWSINHTKVSQTRLNEYKGKNHAQIMHESFLFFESLQ